MKSEVYTRPLKPKMVRKVAAIPPPEVARGTVTPVVAIPKGTECFTTPAQVAEQLVAAAHVEPWHSVLEPSAGTGCLVRALPAGCLIDAIELHPVLCAALVDQGISVKQGDFLAVPAVARYDRVVLNPPFSADMAHVRHAFDFLKPGGLVAAITSPAWTFHAKSEAVRFREWLKLHPHTWQPLPEGSFKNSGTAVSAGILIIHNHARGK